MYKCIYVRTRIHIYIHACISLSLYIYIYIYVYVYIYIYILCMYMGCPPTKSFPTKSPRVKLSGRLPIKFNGHENSHPLELRVCLSQTLRNPNS